MASASTCELTVTGYEPVRADVGATLLEACEAAGIPMETACGGFACCNSCRVEVLGGELTPQVEEEEVFLDAPGQRLGCQARVVAGPIVIRLAPGM